MTRTTRRGAAAVVALVLTVGLVGCGSGDEPAGDDAGSTFTATAAPTSHPAGAGARADLTDATCEAENGEWALHGVLQNSGDAEATYTVTASVAEIDGGNVKGSAEIVETIAPGEEAEFSDVIRADAGEGLHCVISVHRK